MELPKSGLDHDEAHCTSTKQLEYDKLWRSTKNDGMVPFQAYTLTQSEKDAKALKKVDFKFEDDILTLNMCKPDNNPKKFKEARCLKNNHIMQLAQLDRYWACNGGACGNPRTGRSDWPRDVMYYTCEQCDQDFCPTCFSVVEKTIIIKKTEYDEDPDEFKATQRVYCKLRNTYVKI